MAASALPNLGSEAASMSRANRKNAVAYSDDSVEKLILEVAMKV
jgi:hypothetical protein